MVPAMSLLAMPLSLLSFMSFMTTPGTAQQPSATTANSSRSRIAWGFGGSAMQMEGAWNVDGKGLSTWDAYYIKNNIKTHTPFVAADHYHRYKDDLAFLGQLGATAYRFSVSWARILPNCTGQVNEAGIKFYANYIDEIRRQGAEPFLTMFHWDLPQVCWDRFMGFQSDQIVDALVEYASILFERLGSKVTYWLTINEPNAYCNFCLHKSIFPPHTTTSEDTFYACIKRGILAHARIARLGKSINPTWQFSMPHIMEWVEPPSPYSYLHVQTGLIFDPCVFGNWGDVTMDQMPGLPAFTANESDILKGSCDFIGVNIYSITGLQANPIADPDYWPNPNPIAVRNMPKFLYDRYNIPIAIVEMGFHVPQSYEPDFDSTIDDDWRVQFWNQALPAVMAAIEEDGVPLFAMLAWALLDNYEFNTFKYRWGHIAVDYFDKDGNVDTGLGSLTRRVKKSAGVLSDFFARHAENPFMKSVAATSSASTPLTSSTSAVSQVVSTRSDPTNKIDSTKSDASNVGVLFAYLTVLLVSALLTL